jgi:hypothetical protein
MRLSAAFFHFALRFLLWFFIRVFGRIVFFGAFFLGEKMNLHLMNDETLLASFTSLIELERKTTREIVEHLIEIEKRRAYVELGYPNPIDWLVRHYKMSESSAWRRVNAARALRAAPEWVEKIETGALNISTLAKTHAVVRNEEKRTGVKISAEAKSELIYEIQSKTLREAEITLARKFPDQPKREVVQSIDGESVRAHVTLTEAQLAKITRVREILSHKTPNASLAEVLDAALDEFLERKDPLKKVVKERRSKITPGASEALTRRPKPSLQNAVIRETNATCTFESPVTGVLAARKSFGERLVSRRSPR